MKTINQFLYIIIFSFMFSCTVSKDMSYQDDIYSAENEIIFADNNTDQKNQEEEDYYDAEYGDLYEDDQYDFYGENNTTYITNNNYNSRYSDRFQRFNNSGFYFGVSYWQNPYCYNNWYSYNSCFCGMNNNYWNNNWWGYGYPYNSFYSNNFYGNGWNNYYSNNFYGNGYGWGNNWGNPWNNYWVNSWGNNYQTNNFYGMVGTMTTTTALALTMATTDQLVHHQPTAHPITTAMIIMLL